MSERLKNAIIRFHKAFPQNGELDLIKTSAEHHGVDAITGDIFEPMVRTSKAKNRGAGAYNERLFTAENIADLENVVARLKNVRSLNILCEDYRQSEDVYRLLGLDPDLDAVLGLAGGPTQPRKDNQKAEKDNSERHEALVEFITAFAEVNPTAVIRLIAHDEKCGGHAYFIGTAAKILDTALEDGKEPLAARSEEDQEMIKDLHFIANELIVRINPDFDAMAASDEEKEKMRTILKLFIAQITPSNEFDRLLEVPLFDE